MDKIKTTYLILAATLLFAACQKPAKKDESLQSQNFAAQRSTFFNNLVAPSVVAGQLRTLMAEFHPALMSDPKMFSHYAANEVKAAANLGIYLADLNYTIAYSQSGLAEEYFEASYELSMAAGIEKSVLEFLKSRYHKNLSSNDSVAAVVDDLLAKATRGFQGTRKERLAGIAMAAYQIENLHLALGLFQLDSKDVVGADARAPLVKMIVSQQGSVETIYNFLKTYSDPLDPDQNPNYPYYANAFLELMAAYKMVGSEGNQIQLTDSAIIGLVEKVNAIRSKILSIG